MNKFRAWDEFEKDFVYFTNIERLDFYCDKQYRILNICNIDSFTGLKEDENLWYQNDIITDNKTNWQIEWSTEDLTWILTNPNMKGNLKLADINSRLWHKVGNIYQNSSLLTIV